MKSVIFVICIFSALDKEIRVYKVSILGQNIRTVSVCDRDMPKLSVSDHEVHEFIVLR